MVIISLCFNLHLFYYSIYSSWQHSLRFRDQHIYSTCTQFTIQCLWPVQSTIGSAEVIAVVCNNDYSVSYWQIYMEKSRNRSRIIQDIFCASALAIHSSIVVASVIESISYGCFVVLCAAHSQRRHADASARVRVAIPFVIQIPYDFSGILFCEMGASWSGI